MTAQFMRIAVSRWFERESMRSTVISPDQYRSQLSGIARPSVMAAATAADAMTKQDLDLDRYFGGDLWSMFTSEAHSAEAAAKVAAVFFCVSIIAESVGSLSIDIIDRETQEPDPDFYLGDILSYGPNALQTGAEFWSSLTYRAALGGRAFAEPVINRSGELEIWPLDSAKTEVEWHDRDFRLQYSDGVRTRNLRPQDLFWISGLADAKLKPLTPWRMAQSSINFALALENQGREFFKNGKRLGGMLSTDQKLTPEAHEHLGRSMKGWRHGQIPVLEQGLNFNAVSSSNVDSQMVELIKQRTLEMALYWRIPTSMVSESGGKSNQEQEAIGFVKYAVRPMARRIEQAIWKRLLTPEQRLQYRARLNLDSLLRGDSGTQIKNAVMIRNMAAGSVNDVRTRMLGWPKINEDWADNPREPMNSNRAADTITGGETSPQDKE